VRPALAVERAAVAHADGLRPLLTVQTLSVYAAVARIPVGLALLAFNLYPLCAAGWAALLYRHRPERAVLVAIPVIFLGLALALDVAGAASGLGARAQWSQIGAGVGFRGARGR
jgi:drug/metabolite transporter (DMT)-like permease